MIRLIVQIPDPDLPIASRERPMSAIFDRFIQAELTRLRLVERILHEPLVAWQVEVAGLRVPMVVCYWDETLHISADFPALCPLEDEPVGYLIANGEPVYSVALPEEVHSGRGFQVSVSWSVSQLTREAS